MRLTLINSAMHYRIVVMGGGTAGLAISARFAKHVPKGQLAVFEPATNHYYQGGFTLVGSGLKSLASCVKPMQSVINKDAVWIKKAITELRPKSSSVILSDGSEVKYDILVVAPGLELRYDLVEGLPEALMLPGVCSIYRPHLAQKTDRELHAFTGGDAVFTFPNTPIKCAGAPQKICYVANDIFSIAGVRGKTNISYNTSLGRVFGVEKYAITLNRLMKEKNIQLNVRRSLIKVNPDTQIATFDMLDDNAKPTGKTADLHYDLLHVAPPCTPLKPLRECPELTDAGGWLDVDPKTLQSKHFDNVLGIGDCLNTPNAKTGAAVSSQMRTMNKNLPALLNGKPLKGEYDGYASCPLMVSLNRVVMAEFNADGPLETLPINGANPRYITFLIKRYMLPFLYWNFLIKGNWLGPATVRRLLRLGFSK